MGRRRTTQREFIAAAQGAGAVSYVHPGTFRAGAHEITLPTCRVTKFACRLSAVIGFEAYDRLTRSIWIAHLRAGP